MSHNTQPGVEYFPFPYDFASITSKLPVEYFTILYDFCQYSTGIDFWMRFSSKKVERECQYLTNLKLALKNTQWHSKNQLGGYWLRQYPPRRFFEYHRVFFNTNFKSVRYYYNTDPLVVWYCGTLGLSPTPVISALIKPNTSSDINI